MGPGLRVEAIRSGLARAGLVTGRMLALDWAPKQGR